MQILSHYLNHIEALAPLIKQSADQADREQRLPTALISALHEAKLFRLLLPKAYGGAEISPPVFSQIIEAVARLDASTAWCLCQANGCAMAAAYVKPAVADAVWGSDLHAVLAWGPGSKAMAKRDGDGYLVSGKWSFASGCHHATWLGSQSTIINPDGTAQRNAEGEAVLRTLLIPATETDLIPSWDVLGLRGTGSDSFVLDKHFVHHDFSVSRDDPAERQYQAPLYLFPAMSLYASGFSGTALGIAHAMLEAFKELAGSKRPRLAKQVLRNNAVIQAEVAQAQAQLGAARAFLQQELNTIWDETLTTNEVSIDQRMRIRLATTHAIHQAKQVADTVYDLAGASAIFAGSPFERRFRDLHTVTQQLQGRKSHFQTVGAYLLGHEPDLGVI